MPYHMTVREAVCARAGQIYLINTKKGLPDTPFANWLQAEADLGVSHSCVAVAAYYMYLYRISIGLNGSDKTDWFQQERELYETHRRLHGDPVAA